MTNVSEQISGQESSAQAGRWLGGLCSLQQADIQEDGGTSRGSITRARFPAGSLGILLPLRAPAHNLLHGILTPNSLHRLGEVAQAQMLWCAQRQRHAGFRFTGQGRTHEKSVVNPISSCSGAGHITFS